jgi:hypothetical protein
MITNKTFVNLKFVRKCLLRNISIKQNQGNKFNNISAFINYSNDNIFQFEYKKQDKINHFYATLGQLIHATPTSQLYKITLDSKLKPLLDYLTGNNHILLYDFNSLVISSVFLNIIKNKEKLFLVNYALSNNNKLTKLFKYGGDILLKHRNNLLRHVYITLTTFDESNLPLVKNSYDYIALLIYSKYLFIKANGLNTIDDYISLLNKYFELLSSNKDVAGRVKVLESTIGLLNLKKEYPIIKLLSDINLSHFREYFKDYSFAETVTMFSLITSNNFILNYDLSLFYDLVVQNLLDNFDENEVYDLTILIEVLFGIEKVSVSDVNSLNLKTKVVKQLITNYPEFSEKNNLQLFYGEVILNKLDHHMKDINTILIFMSEQYKNHLNIAYNGTNLDLFIKDLVSVYKKVEADVDVTDKFVIYITLKYISQNYKTTIKEEYFKNSYELTYILKNN